MAEPYLGISVQFYIFGRYINISTPNWTHDDAHKPRLIPKWEYFEFHDIPCNLSKMFMFDWFFHFSAMWGKPTNFKWPEDEKKQEASGE